MVLFLANGAVAVTWDLGAGYNIPTTTGQFAIPSLGGTIIIDKFNLPSFNGSQPDSGFTSGVLPAGVSDTASWSGSGSSITWNATAGGGVLPNGVTANGSVDTQYNLNSLNYGINLGYQNSISTVQRSFLPVLGEEVTVSASFAGLANWPTLGDPNSDFLYNTYKISGLVYVTPYLVGGSQAGAASIINLNNTTWSGSFNFTHTNPNVYYVLYAQLTLETYLQNATYPPLNWGALNPNSNSSDGSHSIAGNSPFQLNATVVSAVPIPGSLILLVSGVAGLVAIKRRKAA
jgi:hypothetical protein